MTTSTTTNTTTRVINKGNLLVCIVSFVVAFLISIHATGTVEAEYSQLEKGRGLPPGLSGAPAWVHLPEPAASTRVAVGGTYGTLDVSSRVAQFFFTTLPALDTMSEGFPTQTYTLSDLYRRVIFRRRFHADASPVGKDATSLNILHLCAARACVGPVLTRLFAQRTAAAAGATTPLATFALLAGDRAMAAVAATVLRGEHRVWTVMPRTAPPEEKGAAHSFLCRPLRGLLHEPLYGSEAADLNAPLQANCTQHHCHYRRNDSTASAGDPGTKANEVNWPLVSLRPFHSASFGDEKWLHRFPMHHVHIDLGADHASAAALYLNGVAGDIAEAHLLPSSILLSLHASSFLAEITAAVAQLAASHRYAILPLAGTGAEPCTTSGAALSVTEWKTWAETQRYAPLHPSLHERAGKPLCVLLLSRTHSTIAALVEELRREPKPEGEHDPKSNPIARFISPERGGDALSRPVEDVLPPLLGNTTSSSSGDHSAMVRLGGLLGKALKVLMRVSILAIPFGICATLVWNLSKSWRARPRS